MPLRSYLSWVRFVGGGREPSGDAPSAQPSEEALQTQGHSQSPLRLQSSVQPQSSQPPESAQPPPYTSEDPLATPRQGSTTPQHTESSEQGAPPPYAQRAGPLREQHPVLRRVPQGRTPLVQEEEEEQEPREWRREEEEGEGEAIDGLMAQRIRAANEFRAHIAMFVRANENLSDRLHWQRRDYAVLWSQYLGLQRENATLRARQRARDEVYDRMVARARVEAWEWRFARDQCSLENRELRERCRMLERVLARVEQQVRMGGGGRADGGGGGDSKTSSDDDPRAVESHQQVRVSAVLSGGDHTGVDEMYRMACTRPAEFLERSSGLLDEVRGLAREDHHGVVNNQCSKQEGTLVVPGAIAQARQGAGPAITAATTTTRRPHNDMMTEHLCADKDPLGGSFSRLIAPQAALSRQRMRTDMASTITSTRSPSPQSGSSSAPAQEQTRQDFKEH